MAGPSSPHAPLPPYLGSWALASLAFTSPIVLSLLLVVLRLILAINSANASVDGAKIRLAFSCLGLEQAAGTAVSFPHYLAANVNNATADGAEAIVHGLGTVLDLSVVAIREILIFIVEMYRSMYLCLADLVVRGSMALAIGATREFSEFLTSTLTGLQSTIGGALEGAESALSTVINGINAIPGVNIDPPSLDVNLDFLNNVTLPDGFMQSLLALNSSLPTLDELRDSMNGVIAGPFNDLRQDINRTMANATVDRSLLPVPAKQTMQFCQDLDMAFVDDVGHSLVKVAQYGIIAICVVIVLYIGTMVFVERRWYASLQDYVQVSRSTWISDMSLSATERTAGANRDTIGREDADRVLNPHTLLGFIGASGNPVLRTFVHWFADLVPPLRRSPRARSNFTWFVAYVTYLPALLLLTVAVLGLVSIEIQLAALKPTEASAEKQVDQGLSHFRRSILDRINAATYAQSAEYSNKTNEVLMALETGLNDNLFAWVNTTSVALNTTIVDFYDGLTGAINTTFQGTVFAAPALDVVHCLLGTKVEGISTALTWLHDNAHVDLPLVSDNIFALSPESSDELVSSLDGGGEQSGSSSSIVRTLVDQYRNALIKERQVFFFLLGLYGLVVLFALLALLWHEVVGPSVRRRKHGRPCTPAMKELTLEKSVIPHRSRNEHEADASAARSVFAGAATRWLAFASLRGRSPNQQTEPASTGARTYDSEKVGLASFKFPVLLRNHGRQASDYSERKAAISLPFATPSAQSSWNANAALPPAYGQALHAASESTTSLLNRQHLPVPPVPLPQRPRQHSRPSASAMPGRLRQTAAALRPTPSSITQSKSSPLSFQDRADASGRNSPSPPPRPAPPAPQVQRADSPDLPLPYLYGSTASVSASALSTNPFESIPLNDAGRPFTNFQPARNPFTTPFDGPSES